MRRWVVMRFVGEKKSREEKRKVERMSVEMMKSSH